MTDKKALMIEGGPFIVGRMLDDGEIVIYNRGFDSREEAEAFCASETDYPSDSFNIIDIREIGNRIA